ncbi:helix-turn-helix transcriptional regulator [Streptomyces sp. M19]
MERVAAQVGFGSPTAFRDRFKRVTGVTPQSYRHAFQ